MDEITGWLVGRLPADWFEAAPEVTVDREEVVVVGRLAAPETGAPAAAEHEAGEHGAGEDGAGEEADAAQRAAEAGRIERFREETRRDRMRIADDAQARFGRKVAWGAACGESRAVFTNLSVPVMTRLRQPERRVLDTLVDGGVARSRSEALAWCVRLVGRHEGDWIRQLQDALVDVRRAREQGPAA